MQNLLEHSNFHSDEHFNDGDKGNRYYVIPC